MTMVEDTIRDTTATIWGALLGLEVRETPFGLLPIGPADTLVGEVGIRGAWQGRVLVHCARDLVRVVASKMFDTTLAATTEDQLQDALGEVTNMTGGNVKSILAEGCALGQPHVEADSSFSPLPGGQAIVSQLAFECGGQPFVVSLLGEELSR